MMAGSFHKTFESVRRTGSSLAGGETEDGGSGDERLCPSGTVWPDMLAKIDVLFASADALASSVSAAAGNSVDVVATSLGFEFSTFMFGEERIMINYKAIVGYLILSRRLD